MPHRKKKQPLSLKIVNMLDKNHQYEEHHGKLHVRCSRTGHKELEHLDEHHDKYYPKIKNPLN